MNIHTVNKYIKERWTKEGSFLFSDMLISATVPFESVTTEIFPPDELQKLQCMSLSTYAKHRIMVRRQNVETS
jgi:hypothetical protein